MNGDSPPLPKEKRVFVCTDFKGHYPVGAAAVVLADSESDARRYLSNALEFRKLPASEFTLREITDFYGAEILCDGNY